MSSMALLDEIEAILNELQPSASDLKKNEEVLETLTIDVLVPIAKKYHKNLQKHPKSQRERDQIADISIGISEILIEIKLLKNLNDLYRLFYQAIKYLRLSRIAVVLFIWDTNNVLKKEDREDLMSLERPPKFIRIVSRK